MLILTIIFLAGTFFLTTMNSALRRLPRSDAQRELNSLGNFFFYRKFHLWFFPEREYEGLFFATLCAQNFARFCYVGGILALLTYSQLFHEAFLDIDTQKLYDPAWILAVLILLAFILVTFFLGDYLPRILGTSYPHYSIILCAPFASFYMLGVFPLTYFFLKISRSLPRSVTFEATFEPRGRQEILELLKREDLVTTLETHERKLIESVLKFKERIAREVMVPRVDVFSLSDDTTIAEAAAQLEKEDYSRTPIYHDTVDNIVGVLMYKDILKKYMEFAQKGNDAKILAAPISTIQKNVLHTPETKKISSLLQEFRKKQVHLAIVVDEYGGTEGIVTIEDILEEIVGEISDEYDKAEALFWPCPDGSWVVDARMNIIDIEDELGIAIPEEGEYDTIGGYVYHKTGTIPPKGFVIHHDDFDVVIVESNERSVDKVRLKKRKPSENEEVDSSQ